nr:hypothetical protein [Tanacetum cinerariifolium]
MKEQAYNVDRDEDKSLTTTAISMNLRMSVTMNSLRGRFFDPFIEIPSDEVRYALRFCQCCGEICYRFLTARSRCLGDDHVSDTHDDDDDEDDETKSDEDEIYQYKISVRTDKDERISDAEVAGSDKGDEEVIGAAKIDAKKTSEVKDDGNPDSVSRSLETGDLILEELTAKIDLDDSIPTETDDGFYDSEGDILFLEHLLIEEIFFDPTPPGRKTREMETPSFGFHHRPLPRPAAYSPMEWTLVAKIEEKGEYSIIISERFEACGVLDEINGHLKCLFLLWHSGFQSDISRANLYSLSQRMKSTFHHEQQFVESLKDL